MSYEPMILPDVVLLYGTTGSNGVANVSTCSSCISGARLPLFSLRKLPSVLHFFVLFAHQLTLHNFLWLFDV